MTSKVFDLGQNVIAKDGGVGSVVLQRCEALFYSSELTERLRGKKTSTKILHPCRMDVPQGSITAILGTAESGKSTLLKFLAGCSERTCPVKVQFIYLGRAHIFLSKLVFIDFIHLVRTLSTMADYSLMERGEWASKVQHVSHSPSADTEPTLIASVMQLIGKWRFGIGSKREPVAPFRMIWSHASLQ